MPADANEVSIEVTAFKARCLAAIDDVARGQDASRRADEAQSAG
jgi:hypothetical protein